MLFRDISYYLDKAKENNGISSDRKLCDALGYKGRMTTYLRKGHALPSPEKMIEIADMAGIDHETALLDLGMWSTRGKAKDAYASILQKVSRVTIACFSALLVVVFSSAPALASVSNVAGTFTHAHFLIYILSHIYCVFSADQKLISRSPVITLNHCFIANIFALPITLSWFVICIITIILKPNIPAIIILIGAISHEKFRIDFIKIEHTKSDIKEHIVPFRSN